MTNNPFYIEDLNLLPAHKRDSVGNELSFLPLFSCMKEHDYDTIAREVAKIYNFFYVREDAPHSKTFADALRRYARPEYENALLACMYTSSWMTARKMMNRMKADMDRGKIPVARNTFVFTMFTFSDHTPINCNYAFKINSNFRKLKKI